MNHGGISDRGPFRPNAHSLLHTCPRPDSLLVFGTFPDLTLALIRFTRTVNSFPKCSNSRRCRPGLMFNGCPYGKTFVRWHGEAGGRTVAQVVDLVFTQARRVEVIDGGRNGTGAQAKPYLDREHGRSYVEAQAESGCSTREYCCGQGLRSMTWFAVFSQPRSSAERSMGVDLQTSCPRGTRPTLYSGRHSKRR